MERWQPAYIGVGGNLNDPRLQVIRAFDSLAALPRTRLIARSPLYQSRPFGPVAQPDFVNAVAGLVTELTAHELFGELQGLERQFGPVGGRGWADRKARDVALDCAEQPDGVFVAEAAGAVVGYVTTRLDHFASVGRIPNLAVTEAHRAQHDR